MNTDSVIIMGRLMGSIFLLLIGWVMMMMMRRVTASEVDYSSLLQSINQERQGINLPPLCPSERLSDIAQRYADYQALHSMGGHYADGHTPQQRVPSSLAVSELLFEGRYLAHLRPIIDQLLQKYESSRTALKEGQLTHLGVGKSATTDAGNQPYYYWVILIAQLAEPCPDLPSKSNSGFLMPRSRTHPSKYLPEYLAPPEEQTIVRRTVQEPISGMGGTEKVERINQLYTDTLPRVVDGTKDASPVVDNMDSTREWRPSKYNLANDPSQPQEEQVVQQVIINSPNDFPPPTAPDTIPLFWT